MAEKGLLIERIGALRLKRRAASKRLDELKVRELIPILAEERRFWTCKRCRQEKGVIAWNERVDMLVCQNGGCSYFHTPAGNIPAFG